MELLLWIIIIILLIGFGFAPVVWIMAAIGVVYFVLVILGKIFMFFEEVKEVKRFPKEVKRSPKEVKKYNEKVDKITNSTLILGFLSIVFFSALITAVG